MKKIIDVYEKVITNYDVLYFVVTKFGDHSVTCATDRYSKEWQVRFWLDDAYPMPSVFVKIRNINTLRRAVKREVKKYLSYAGSIKLHPDMKEEKITLLNQQMKKKK
jgi:hypothetical protein